MMYIQDLARSFDLSCILVQTAYCNSRVTQFLKDKGIKSQLVKTGVKFAEPVVIQYDIGANDEPNGHGTVSYNEDKIAKLPIEAQKLKSLLSISNRVVGDAIANFLLIEAILYDLDMSIE